MVIDLKFSRFADEPWGFRLTGGADMEFPLTVIKVTEESLADQAGLKFGDIVVRINDTPASNLTHVEAHNVLVMAGNNFMIGVKRDNEKVEPELTNDYVSEGEQEVRKILMNVGQPQDDAVNFPEISEDRVEEQIAEILSSEAEYLKEHNIIGVNFNKLIPKAQAMKSSAVLRELNEEAVKTEQDKQNEVQKWTTFLQKPDRPIPKSKEEIAREKRQQYQVQIVKQPQPRVAPNRVATPPTEIPVAQEQPDATKVPAPETMDEEIECSAAAEENTENELLTEEQIQVIVENTADDEVPDLEEAEEMENAVNTEETGIPNDLERQLADVQKQLLALSNLPQAIQATLDAVTHELAKIVPAIREVSCSSSNSKQASMDREYRSKSPSRDVEQRPNEIIEVIETTEITCEPSTLDSSASSSRSQSVVEAVVHETEESVAIEPVQEPKIGLEQEQERKMADLEVKKKEEFVDDLKRSVRSKREPGRLSKNVSVFGPLVPQERPIYLPGGRKWRNAKDAYNDDYIAEVLSSQAELIVGSTLGTYESPLLPFDKVNFLKYKKPEKKVDLKNSAVYKIIHNLDHEPVTGIQVRPERVAAEEEVRRSAAPGQ